MHVSVSRPSKSLAVGGGSWNRVHKAGYLPSHVVTITEDRVKLVLCNQCYLILTGVRGDCRRMELLYVR